MSESILKYVIKRLEQWADWYSRGNGYHLGYPPCSPEHRLMMGGRAACNTGSPPIVSNAEADEIEELVKEMSGQNRAIALVIRCHYFMRGSLRSKSNRLKKLDVEISHTHFKRYVDMGHQWLAARLSDHKKRK